MRGSFSLDLAVFAVIPVTELSDLSFENRRNYDKEIGRDKEQKSCPESKCDNGGDKNKMTNKPTEPYSAHGAQRICGDENRKKDRHTKRKRKMRSAQRPSHKNTKKNQANYQERSYDAIENPDCFLLFDASDVISGNTERKISERTNRDKNKNVIPKSRAKKPLKVPGKCEPSRL